jgi:hypothetical protein
MILLQKETRLALSAIVNGRKHPTDVLDQQKLASEWLLLRPKRGVEARRVGRRVFDRKEIGELIL